MLVQLRERFSEYAADQPFRAPAGVGAAPGRAKADKRVHALAHTGHRKGTQPDQAAVRMAHDVYPFRALGQRHDEFGDLGGADVEKLGAPAPVERGEKPHAPDGQFVRERAEHVRFAERAVQGDHDVGLGGCCGGVGKTPRDVGRERHRE